MKFKILILVAIFFCSCGQEKFLKKKFDETITFTNKSPDTIKKLRMWGGSAKDSSKSKVWTWENITTGNSVSVVFNIKRDIQVSEGSIYYEAVINDNDTLRGDTHFTNWQMIGGENVDIHKDKFEIK